MEGDRTQDDLLSRIALDQYLGSAPRRSPKARVQEQVIPLNVYETADDIVLVAPMPGVEPDNIDIEVLQNTVTLRATMRGPHQQDREYLLHEWTYGPYVRTVSLPVDVEAEGANASHGNGVLVLTLPKAVRSRSIQVSFRGSKSGNAAGAGQ